jgi:hypothetical protein
MKEGAMSCGCRTSDPSGRVSDQLETGGARRPFDHSATAWLVGQGVRYLNADDKEGELAYQRVIELLRHCAEDLVETVAGLLRAAPAGDAPLRWCLLHVLGDAAGPRATELLVQLSVERLPESNVDEGCEGLRDAELLVRTMAVHAVGRIAGRHPETKDHVLKIVSARPDRALLIEACKVAGDLGIKDRARELLRQDEHWMLDIRRARTEEVFVEPEREDGKERGFTPPRSGTLVTSPHVACGSRKGGLTHG